MSTDLDTTRIVRSWLRTDEHESAERILDDVLVLLDATPQRRSWWPARRIADMNTFAKFLIAAAAIVALAVAINLLPWTGGDIGVTPASPSATASPTPSPTAQPLTTSGALAPGTYALSSGLARLGPPLIVTVPSGWSAFCDGPNGRLVPDESKTCFAVFGGPGQTMKLVYSTIDNVYVDPCGHVMRQPPVGPGVDDLVDAIAGLEGTDGSSPVDATIGGRPARYVEFGVPAEIPCGSSDFYLWQVSGPWTRYAESPGHRFRVWVLDIEGQRVMIEADWFADTSAADLAVLSGVIESIRFD